MFHQLLMTPVPCGPARILEALHHPNIVGFREVYATKKGNLNIVMEYCDDGDLARKVKDKSIENARTGKKESFSEQQVL